MKLITGNIFNRLYRRLHHWTNLVFNRKTAFELNI